MCQKRKIEFDISHYLSVLYPGIHHFETFSPWAKAVTRFLPLQDWRKRSNDVIVYELQILINVKHLLNLDENTSWSFVFALYLICFPQRTGG